ncbi:hypothetical protein MLD38_004178 [Melastoma candidum]|uniref:Uncharacterized protein n=1 Tax=Melastoma candidum TaxID=119954 RepID=A0ACB9S581_9MYRT|nr:hypothetical protein MLD38_004178 [Melastoma candidum]
MKSSASGLSFSSTLLSAEKKEVAAPVRWSLAAGPAGRGLAKACAFSYRKFVEFGLGELGRRAHLIPSPLQGEFSSRKALDGKTEMEFLAYKAPGIRLIRSLRIGGGGDGMQVLDFAIFPEPEYDLPIFCANFFSASNTNIVVLDLNPLHNVIENDDYKEKYYHGLLPLGMKYAEALPWGGKLTSESLSFFSPIVIWTRFPSSKDMHEVLYSAFVDYLKAWVSLMDLAAREVDLSVVVAHHKAQHRYLTWRAEKDPGHQVLRRLIGEADTKTVIRRFLFDGVDSLGSKTFLDYFPEYQCKDGSINEKRSMVGKSFASRPWSPSGKFIGKGTAD